MDLVRRRLLVAVALTVVLAASCRNGAGGVDGRTGRQVAALTATPSASGAAREQALADAFGRQAAVYANLAAADRAQAAALSATIMTEQQLAAVAAAARPQPATATVAASGTAATAAATSGTSVTTLAPATGGVPAAAAKSEASYQKAAALADRLGANVQRLASFHLARVNQLAGAAGKGGAQ
jgi:hypothetical protein